MKRLLSTLALLVVSGILVALGFKKYRKSNGRNTLGSVLFL